MPSALRSWMMSRVRGKNTKPELALRRALRAAAIPFSTYVKSLPGRPDVVLPRFRRAVFVQGCFWHSHSCKRGARPKTNVAFWNAKLDRNRIRDQACQSALRRAGWKVTVLWECRIQQGIGQLLGLLRKDALRLAKGTGVNVARRTARVSVVPRSRSSERPARARPSGRTHTL